MKPILFLVVPCFNEEKVISITAPVFEEKIVSLVNCGKIAKGSKILFVDDGSTDSTWQIISSLASDNPHFIGISLSRNRGHQNALLAGLMEAKDKCDITVSIDCDGQDDINAIDKMVDEYYNGADIVYGVRSNRRADSPFKRITAQGFYKLLNAMGAQVVYNHADYRLISSKALRELTKFNEVNIFLRGMVPMVGFKSTSVYYERSQRLAGKSKYPLSKMLSLAFDGITSLTVKPIRFITVLGLIVAAISFVG
ncbi:MAG: glycosyltransferase family 2 protein, partial [Clostridia bacterium]|nr:glycosyltransferase family 2 protein [Clostridia bacterium]